MCFVKQIYFVNDSKTHFVNTRFLKNLTHNKNLNFFLKTKLLKHIAVFGVHTLYCFHPHCLRSVDRNSTHSKCIIYKGFLPPHYVNVPENIQYIQSIIPGLMILVIYAANKYSKLRL